MAEGLLRSELAKRGLTATVEVASAGVGVRHAGGDADPRAVRVAQERGIDISGHHARLLAEAAIDAADLVVVMDHGTAAGVGAITGRSDPRGAGSPQLRLLMSFADDATLPREIADPYVTDTPEAYERAFDLIAVACVGLADAIAAVLSAPAARPTC